MHVSNDPLTGKLQLDLLLTGARRKKPGSQDKRLPITPIILEKVFSVLNSNPTNFENKLGFSSFVFSVLGSLPHNHDPSWHLSIQDITVDSTTNLSILATGHHKRVQDGPIQLWSGGRIRISARSIGIHRIYGF